MSINPSFVGYAGFNPEAGLFLRQLRDAGYTGGYGSVDAAASQANFVDPLGPIAENVLFAGCQVDLPTSFDEEFLAQHGHERAGATFTGHYADAARALLDAVARVAREQPDGSLVIEPASLRDALRNDTYMQDALTGSIAFDAQGDRVPSPGDDLSQVIGEGFATEDSPLLDALGFVQCQVQNGVLVNVSSPGSPEIR